LEAITKAVVVSDDVELEGDRFNRNLSAKTVSVSLIQFHRLVDLPPD